MSINEEVVFFYQCYKQKKATDNVLNNVRKYFKNNPIYLICDNGDDMRDLAQKYNCIYSYEKRLCNNSKNFTNWTPEICLNWLNRILKVAEDCKKKYIINLEDDVICYNKIKKIPKGDINGIFDCKWAPNKFRNSFLKYLKRKNVKIKYKYYGSCGGFIMKTDSFINVMKNTNVYLLKKLNKYDKRIGTTSDCSITALFLINNFTYEPWEDLKSKWDGRNITEYAFYHPDKSLYI